MKKYREDLNRHIPQKINEFASLALAEGTPSLYTELGLPLSIIFCVCFRVFSNL